jgi:TetR/AcrR family transcriptional regulator, cholesterol catabolism regulator
MSDTASTPRKNQLRKVAARLFRQHGYQATSVRDIAEAVGIQGGSLYAHLDKKDDLLWEIVNHSADRFFEALNPIVLSDHEILHRLRAAIVAHVGVITSDLDAAAVYSSEWRHLPPERREAVAGRRDEYEQMFRDMIRMAIRQGFIADTDESFAALFVLSALNWVYQWYHPDGRYSPEALGKLMADYIFDGLRRRAV